MTFLTMVTQLANGLLVSVEIFVLTLIGSLPLGLLVAFGRMSKWQPFRFLLCGKDNTKKVGGFIAWIAGLRPIRLFTKVYISIMRGTPLMLQLMVVYFLPATIFGAGLPRFAAVIIGMVINYAAYFAEIYRGGIESMPAGQYEAASVLGYSKPQTFCKIILPQVIKHILPSVTNEVITLVKDTSLAYVVSVMEMFTLAKKIASSQTTLMPFVIAGVFYYIFNLVVALIMDHCEKKLSYYR